MAKRKELEALVECLNERLGTNYQLNYCSVYGGYELLMYKPDTHTPVNTCLWEHGMRRSGNDMKSYLLGALHVLQDLGINKEVEKIFKKD